MSELPFELKTELECQIAADSDFLLGLDHGKPRPGHPEGAVKWHVAEVLQNVDNWYAEHPQHQNLRLIALIHDTFKYQVDPSQPKQGENHHAMLARRFAEKFFSDTSVLDVIELHDEAYNAWQKGARDDNWQRARERADILLERLECNLDLYLNFYRCDNATGSKSNAPYDWFVEYSRKF